MLILLFLDTPTLQAPTNLNPKKSYSLIVDAGLAQIQTLMEKPVTQIHSYI